MTQCIPEGLKPRFILRLITSELKLRPPKRQMKRQRGSSDLHWVGSQPEAPASFLKWLLVMNG